MEKAGLTPSCLRDARLDINRSGDPQRGLVNGLMCDGRNFVLEARAITDRGRRYVPEMSIFVAPHNAAVEARSGRGA